MKCLRKTLKYILVTSYVFYFCSFGITDNYAEQSENNYEESSNNDESEIETSSESSANINENETNYKIRDLLSDEVKFMFDSIEKKQFDEISADFDSIYNRIVSVYLSYEEQTNLADLSLLSFLSDKNLMGKQQNEARNKISSLLSNYNMKEKYDPEIYNGMIEKTNNFASLGKKTSYCFPDNVVIIGGKILNDYPISYNGNILISLDDFLNILDKGHEIEYMRNNFNVLIKFETDTLEIQPGKNIAFKNDSQIVLDNPVFNVDGKIYVPSVLLDSLGMKVIKINSSVLIY